MKIKFKCTLKSKSAKSESPKKEIYFLIDKFVAGYLNVFSNPEDESSRVICGNIDERENAICYKSLFPNIYSKSKAVAQILAVSGNAWFTCTGWLASSDSLFFTNMHCLSTRTDVLNSYFYFMNEDSSCSIDDQYAPEFEVYEAEDLLAVEEEYDYALIRLADNPASKFG